MERKWLIAIVIIAIVIVAFLGWYFLYGTPQPVKTVAPTMYVDGALYNTTKITLNLNATQGATYYFPHNASNPGNATIDALFNYTASFYNISSAQWTQMYDGVKWLTSRPNVTALLVRSSGALTPWVNQAFQKQGEQSTYAVYVNYSDTQFAIKLQYLGNKPAVDGTTVFTYLGFDGDADGILDHLDQAFNFTNNPSRADANMLQVYTPANITTWNSTAASPPYAWNGTTSPSSVPVSIAITADRKNVTWTIPYSVIGASKDSYIGIVIQAFSYDFFPTGVAQMPPAPSKYYRLGCLLPPAVGFRFSLLPYTTVNFYLKVTFSANAVPDTRYSFEFTPKIP